MNSGLDLSTGTGDRRAIYRALGLLVVFVCLALYYCRYNGSFYCFEGSEKPAEESGVEKAVSEPLPVARPAGAG